jgi:hypothetical protein
MLPVWPRDLLAKLLKHYIEADADPIHVFGIVPAQADELRLALGIGRKFACHCSLVRFKTVYVAARAIETRVSKTFSRPQAAVRPGIRSRPLTRGKPPLWVIFRVNGALR